MLMVGWMLMHNEELSHRQDCSESADLLTDKKQDSFWQKIWRLLN